MVGMKMGERKSLKKMNLKGLTTLLATLILSMIGTGVFAQRAIKKHTRAAPPTFQPDEFAGVFFHDPLSQLQGERPSGISALASVTSKTPATGDNSLSVATELQSGNDLWKELVSPGTIEDMVKESNSRLDGMITNPAKFAGGGVVQARREFTLIASLMAVIAEYPGEVKWKSSATYARRIFTRMAMNCKVGTQSVFKEAKQRQTDLQSLLKGAKVEGTADEVEWGDTAEMGPTMQLLEWSLRDNLTPATSNDKEFREKKDDVLKYAEFVSLLGNVLQQPGMNYADEAEYKQFAKAMMESAMEVAKATRNNDAEIARSAVSRLNQACTRCHEAYRQ